MAMKITNLPTCTQLMTAEKVEVSVLLSRRLAGKANCLMLSVCLVGVCMQVMLSCYLHCKHCTNIVQITLSNVE